jgi:hypothetical protein
VAAESADAAAPTPPAAGLPEGVVLAPGEALLARARLPLSALTLWVRTDFALTDRRLVARQPRLHALVIPAGSDSVSQPLSGLSSVEVSRRFRWAYLLWGLVCLVLFPLVVTIPIGILLILAAWDAELAVTNAAGARRRYPVSAFSRDEATAFADQINTAVAARG